MLCDKCDNFCTNMCSSCKHTVNGEIQYANFVDDSIQRKPSLESNSLSAEQKRCIKEFASAVSSSEIISSVPDNSEFDDIPKNVGTTSEKTEHVSHVTADEIRKAVESENFEFGNKLSDDADKTESAAEEDASPSVAKEFDISIGTIFNENCNDTMDKHIIPHTIDAVLTSPPYCTSNRAGKKSKATLMTAKKSKYYPSLRYDVFSDNMSPDEYINWSVGLFKRFDNILKENGCVLYNISYSSDNRDMMFRVISAIIEQTNFSIMDMIGWKKHNALPNNISPNKLTRIFEPVFVFARKTEIDTFICNKRVVSVRERTGQKVYENIFNFIDARNNDGSCNLNKATYSSELCEKLLNIYVSPGMSVYDPFMGTGTTAVACKRLGMKCYGSEISEAQCQYATDRILNDSGVSCLLNDDTKAPKAPKAQKKTTATNKEETNEINEDSEAKDCNETEIVTEEN